MSPVFCFVFMNLIGRNIEVQKTGKVSIVHGLERKMFAEIGFNMPKAVEDLKYIMQR